MNAYTRYFDLTTRDTHVSRCSSAKSSLLQAASSDDLEVKRRFLEHSLRQLENAHAQVTLELNDLE